MAWWLAKIAYSCYLFYTSASADHTEEWVYIFEYN